MEGGGETMARKRWDHYKPDKDDDGEDEDASDEPMVARGNPLYAAPLLSADEERNLFIRYHKTRDPTIRERLILANTRLVRDCAYGFARNHYLGAAMDVEDVEVYGQMGLMTAIERFDPTLGFRFSTYATRWILQAMGRGRENEADTIREPSHVQARRRRARKLGEEYAPRARVVSLDKPVDDSPESDVLGDFIPDQDALFEEAVVEQEYWRETLHLALEVLTERERIILTLRYGLVDGEYLTLEACGKLLKITRERVRQIEAHALTQLRLALSENDEGDLVLRRLRLVETQRAEQFRVKRAETMRAWRDKRMAAQATEQTTLAS